MRKTPTDPTSPATGCPLTAALTAIGGKWNMICLYWLAAGERRFGELRRLMPEISQKVLTQTLRDLEQEGLVVRNEIPGKSAHVVYRISSYGETVKPLIADVVSWGRRHLNKA